MRSLTLPIVQQGAGGQFLSGRITVFPLLRRIGEKQFRKLLANEGAVLVTQQQIKGTILDGKEGHHTIHLLRMQGHLPVEKRLCRVGHNRFQATQVNGGMKILFDCLGTVNAVELRIFPFALSLSKGERINPTL
jgi:hypothetical protein